jgi:hypothetical protein
VGLRRDGSLPKNPDGAPADAIRWDGAEREVGASQEAAAQGLGLVSQSGGGREEAGGGGGV